MKRFQLNFAFASVAILLSQTPSLVQAQGQGDTHRNGATSVVAPSVLLDTTELPNGQLPARGKAGSGVQGKFNADTLKASHLKLILPDGTMLMARRKNEVRGARGEQTWVGEIENRPGSLFIMTQYKEHVSGFVHNGAEVWEIESAGHGRSNLYLVDESKLPPDGHVLSARDSATTQTGTGTPTPTVMASLAEPVVQDLLAVYTAAAASANGGAAALEGKITNAVQAANSAYSNSRVGIVLNIVGMRQVDYTETGDMGTSLDRLQGATDGFMDEVHALRDQLGADLVSLMTNESNYCGIAYMAGNAAAYAFSVVTPNCFSNHSLAHEIGHNQGNNHDRVSSGGVTGNGYSYGYRTCDNLALANGQDFRTVMGYPCASSPRVNQFSNPDLYYNNAAPMGISYEANPAQAADNARSMNATAPFIAAYRGSVGAVAVPVAAPSALTGSAQSFSTVNLNWTDNATNETGFLLQRSVNGDTFADRATLGAGVVTFSDTGLIGGTSYSYRIRSFNSAGASAFSNSIIVTTPAAPALPAEPAPASLSGVAKTATLRWNNVAGEAGYEITRSRLSAKGAWLLDATTQTGPDVTTVNITVGKPATYRFSIRAFNNSGMSGSVVPTCTGTNCSADNSIKLR